MQFHSSLNQTFEQKIPSLTTSLWKIAKSGHSRFFFKGSFVRQSNQVANFIENLFLNYFEVSFRQIFLILSNFEEKPLFRDSKPFFKANLDALNAFYFASYTISLLKAIFRLLKILRNAKEFPNPLKFQCLLPTPISKIKCH